MNIDLLLREGEERDIPEIYELICDMESRLLPRELFESILHDQFASDQNYCLVAVADEQVIGVLNLRFERQLHHCAPMAEVMEFAVSSAYRGNGVGSAMFAEACEIARNRGCLQMEVACNQLREDTHRFYLRQGMKNYHYKFSLLLEGEDLGINVLGR